MFREESLKVVVQGLALLVMVLMAGLGLRCLATVRFGWGELGSGVAGWSLSLAGLLALGWLARSPEWFAYVLIRRFTLDANHACWRRFRQDRSITNHTYDPDKAAAVFET